MSETLIDYCGHRWTRRDDGLWESDVGTVRAAPLMTPPTMREDDNGEDSRQGV